MTTKTNTSKSIKRMTIEIPMDLHRQYKQVAAARQTTIREMVTEAMREQLANVQVK